MLVSVYSNKYSVFVQLRYRFRLYPSPGQQQALRGLSAAPGWCSTTRWPPGAPRTRPGCRPVRCDLRREAAAAQDRGGAGALVAPAAGRKFLRRAERKLRKEQQALSRKARGSSNRDKARARVARVHAKVADSRRDWLHKESTRIIRESQAVYVEDLCVAGLARTRLAKSVHDAGWPAFTAMLEYKARKHGREFRKIGRFEPTSQVCSACGVKDGPKPLHVREWACAACGTVHDRDVNAAKNILALGRRESLNACGGDVRPGATLAVAGETGSLRGAA